MRALAAAAALALLACSPQPDASPPGRGGSGGSTGGSGGLAGGSGGSTGGSGGSAGGTGGSTGGAGGSTGGSGGSTGGTGGSGMDSAPEAPAIQLPPPPASCDERPAARHPAAPVHIIKVSPTFAGKPADLGVPISNGSSRVTLSQLRFFVTQPVFIQTNGTPVPAELVDNGGAPLPYGLALVDLEKPDSLTLRLRAPAAGYDRLSLSVGVHPACNSGRPPAALVYPLNAGGGMTWTWTLGYIFLFLEGDKGEGPPAPFAAHAGIFPPTAGAVALTATGDFGRLGVGTVLEARLDRLIEVVDGPNHIDGGRKLMERLPTADFWRVAAP